MNRTAAGDWATRAPPMRIAFFCQAEGGIRDIGVTGVQTCALPILVPEWATWEEFRRLEALGLIARANTRLEPLEYLLLEIGRASCRERVEASEVAQA